MWRQRFSLIVLTSLVPVSYGFAGDLFDEPYIARFALALSRSTNYASAAGMQATVAYPGASSVNPAADDFRRPNGLGEPQTSGTITSIQAFAQSDAWFVATVGTISVRRPQAGTFTFAYARTDTLDKSTQQDLDNLLRSNEFFGGYSKKVSDRLSLGVQGRITDATLHDEAVLPSNGFPTRVEADILAGDVNFGVLAQLNGQWTVGLTAGVGKGSTENVVKNLTFVPLTSPPFGIPPGTTLSEFDDINWTYLVRSGIGFIPSRQIGTFADIEYMQFDSDTAGGTEVGRLFLGTELVPLDDLLIRIGTALDTNEQWTWSTGMSFEPLPRTSIALSYQYNAFPEIKPEFGRFQVVSISIAALF